MSMIQPWRSTVALWSEMALAPTRVAQAQARMTLRMMQAASPWQMRLAAGVVRTAPDGDVRATATVLTLPVAVQPVAETVADAAPMELAEATPAIGEAVEAVGEAVAPSPELSVEGAAASLPAASEQAPSQSEPVGKPVAEVLAAPAQEDHAAVPHGALAESSAAAVTVATAPVEEILHGTSEVLPLEPFGTAEPVEEPEDLTQAAIRPLVAMAEGVAPAAEPVLGMATAPVSSRRSPASTRKSRGQRNG
jgi:hypothetical protein